MDLSDVMLGYFIGFSCYMLYLSSKCYFEVKEGYIATVSAFGKILEDSHLKNQQLKIFSPGLHLKWPWQKIKKVSLMEQMIELSGEEGGTSAIAADGITLRLDSKLRFTPSKDQLYHYLFALERPVEHIKGLFICLLRNEIANFDQEDSKDHQVGSYAFIRQKRKQLNQKIEDFCRMQIGDRYGIRFDGVDLTDILPPDDLAEALNGVINAQSEADKHYAYKENECKQRVLAAEKGLEIAKAKSQATEKEILTMSKILLELQDKEMLHLYISRRKTEVFSDSKTSFIQVQSKS